MNVYFGRDPSDENDMVREPQRTVGAGSSRNRQADSVTVRRDYPRRRDPAYRAIHVHVVREPQGTVGAGSDVDRPADPGAGVVGDDPRRRDAADRVVVGVGEPQGTVGAGSNASRLVTAGSGVVGDDPRCRDPPDRAVAEIGEPHRTVRTGGDLDRGADPGSGVSFDLPGGPAGLGRELCDHGTRTWGGHGSCRSGREHGRADEGGQRTWGRSVQSRATTPPKPCALHPPTATEVQQSGRKLPPGATLAGPRPASQFPFSRDRLLCGPILRRHAANGRRRKGDWDECDAVEASSDEVRGDSDGVCGRLGWDWRPTSCRRRGVLTRYSVRFFDFSLEDPEGGQASGSIQYVIVGRVLSPIRRLYGGR